jgi:hypothetical protein
MNEVLRNRFLHSVSGNNRKSKTCTELRRSIQNLKFDFVVGACLLALSFPAEAQQPKKIPRIGYIATRSGLKPVKKHSCKVCSHSVTSKDKR